MNIIFRFILLCVLYSGKYIFNKKPRVGPSRKPRAESISFFNFIRPSKGKPPLAGRKRTILRLTCIRAGRGIRSFALYDYVRQF